MFLLLYFVYMVIMKLKTKSQTVKTEDLIVVLQNSKKNSTFSWVSFIGHWTTRSYAFRLA